MRLYITEQQYLQHAGGPLEMLTVWHGTKSAACAHSRKNKSKWSAVEVPTRKADLLEFLNKLSGNGDGRELAPDGVYSARPMGLTHAPKPSKPIKRGARK